MNFGVLMGEVISYNASFVNKSGADWSIVGAADAFTGSSSLLNIGMIESNGTSSITGLSGTTNVGTIQVETGSLQIAGPVTGGGTVMIFGATMEFAAASDAHVQFDTGPAPAGTLLLDDVAQFTGTVTGFGGGDTIDLVGIAPGNVSVSNAGGLHVNYGTGSFALGGNYDPAGFSVDSRWQRRHRHYLESPRALHRHHPLHACQQWRDDNHSGAADFRHRSGRFFGHRHGDNRSGRFGKHRLAHVGLGLAIIDQFDARNGGYIQPRATPPSQDMVTLTAVDNFGATDTFHFVFNNHSSVPLKGTPGNDVIFSSGGSDVLTGGGGSDQFVFTPTSGTNPVQHVVTDFSAPLDTIDLRQFSGISASALPTAVQVGNDTLITLDSLDSVLLKNVAASSLHASDYIVHA